MPYKIGDGTMQKDTVLKSDFRCMNCGVHCGFTKKLYCSDCGTVGQRKEMALANEKIKQENLVKGFIYA